MSKKKIFIFSSVHFWNDTRIFYKEAQSLVKKYEVELHAPADFKFRDINGIRIYGLPKWKRVADRRKIRKEIWKRIRKSNADIYHFHDPELIWIGIKAKILLKKRLVYDVHEHYPRAILDKQWIPLIFRRPVSVVFNIFEFICGRFFDGVIFTTRIIGKRFSLKKSICINNYPLMIDFKNDSQCEKKNQIIYVGGISKIRGFVELIKAFQLVTSEHYPNLKLVVIGKYFEEQFEKEVNELISNLKIGEKIKFLHYLPYLQIMPFIAQSKIGIVTYLPYSNNVVCLPNKLFEYMVCGTAVLASDFELYREVVEYAQCGLVVDPTNPDEIAKNMVIMLSDVDKLKSMGKNGRGAVLKKYNWKFEEEKLLDFYKKLLKE